MPELKGFNFSGGSRLIPEFVALAIALSTYTAAFIAEIVRAGILSVHKGQMEAGASLGLSRGSTLRLIVVPQAMRVILPPLTNQYLNLTKNSSLAVAIGYPELFSVFAGTTLSQTGQAIEIIAITMGVYLLISLVTSGIMSFYCWRLTEHGCMSDQPAPSSSSARSSFRSAPRRSGPRALSGSCDPAVQFPDQHAAHDRRSCAAMVYPCSRGDISAVDAVWRGKIERRVWTIKCEQSGRAGRSSRRNSPSSFTAFIQNPNGGG